MFRFYFYVQARNRIRLRYQKPTDRIDSNKRETLNYLRKIKNHQLDVI